MTQFNVTDLWMWMRVAHSNRPPCWPWQPYTRPCPRSNWRSCILAPWWLPREWIAICWDTPDWPEGQLSAAVLGNPEKGRDSKVKLCIIIYLFYDQCLFIAPEVFCKINVLRVSCYDWCFLISGRQCHRALNPDCVVSL